MWPVPQVQLQGQGVHLSPGRRVVLENWAACVGAVCHEEVPQCCVVRCQLPKCIKHRALTSFLLACGGLWLAWLTWRVVRPGACGNRFGHDERGVLQLVACLTKQRQRGTLESACVHLLWGFVLIVCLPECAQRARTTGHAVPSCSAQRGGRQNKGIQHKPRSPPPFRHD